MRTTGKFLLLRRLRAAQFRRGGSRLSSDRQSRSIQQVTLQRLRCSSLLFPNNTVGPSDFCTVSRELSVLCGKVLRRDDMAFDTSFRFGGLAADVLDSITRLANGHVSLQCVGVPNQVNDLQSSPDLHPAHFAPVSPPPPTADANGAFSYDDAGAVGQTVRFYRIVIP